MADLITMMSAAAGQVGGINPREHFNTVLWTGNGNATRTISGVGFNPDFVWIKNRTEGYGHLLQNNVAGINKEMQSNSSGAEVTDFQYGWVSSTNSDGFSLDSSNTPLFVNENTKAFVAWNWKANGAGVSNTAGTITSTVSANTTAGFSIVSYTGNGTNGATVGHGLGVAPQFIITKTRNQTRNWYIWSHNLSGANYGMGFDTNAEAAFSFGNWGTKTSTTIEAVQGASDITNVNGSGDTYIAYCFAEVEGFSKFGSYTGNGSATGPSVTTDFEPTWLMIKRTDTTSDWIIHDSARDASNPRTEYLEPNTSDAEATGNDVDFNSTGFQLKSTSATINASGGTYIYACFA